MDLPVCEHTKIDGVRCGSVALRDQKYCQHHAAMYRLVPAANLFVNLTSPAAELIPQHECTMPYLEDAAAIQVGFMQLISGLSRQRIQAREARLILEALKGAAANLKHTDRLKTRAAELAAQKKPPARVKPVAAAPASSNALSSNYGS
jgi:hypothetical protein